MCLTSGIVKHNSSEQKFSPHFHKQTCPSLDPKSRKHIVCDSLYNIIHVHVDLVYAKMITLFKLTFVQFSGKDHHSLP